MTDHQLASVINAYVTKYPHTSRNKPISACSTSVQRIEKLEAAGLVKLPHKMNMSIAGTLGRKAGGWGEDFYI